MLAPPLTDKPGQPPQPAPATPPAPAPNSPSQTGVNALSPQLHDITIVKRKKYQCARVEGVPPEEFGIARNARSIKHCGYCFHEVQRRQADLIAEGYEATQIKALPSYAPVETGERQARDTVDESRGAGDDGMNEANRLITVTEHYVEMDYEGGGIAREDGRKRPGGARLYRVTTGGTDGEILRKDGEAQVVEVDCPPFAAMTPVIMTHRFFGRSIADLVMDIQRIKTALMRGLLDNLYLHNNPRVEVPESHASDNTLDDLLVSRPGGIVRTKAPGGLQWQVVPDITQSVYPALQYFDATREWRTGVSRQGQGVDPNALQNQVATIANQMFNAAQAKTKLIARIFAETGIRDLFSLLHGVIRKHGSVSETVRLRNKWVHVNPREWKEREDMRINVALGTGTREQELASAQLIIAAQEKAIALGLVTKKNFWESAKELTRLAGHKDATRFFTPPGAQADPNDPDATTPIPTPENPEIEKAKVEAQLELAKLEKQSAIEKLQAQADIATTQQRTQAEIARNDRRFQQESVQSEREHQMKMAEMQLKLVSQLAAASAGGKPAPAVMGPDGQPVPAQPGTPSMDELVAKLSPLFTPAQPMPRARRRSIKTPSGKVYEMTEE